MLFIKLQYQTFIRYVYIKITFEFMTVILFESNYFFYNIIYFPTFSKHLICPKNKILNMFNFF